MAQGEAEPTKYWLSTLPAEISPCFGYLQELGEDITFTGKPTAARICESHKVVAADVPRRRLQPAWGLELTLKKRHAATAYALGSEQVHARRPCLARHAHRFASLAMMPLVELPRAIEFRQAIERHLSLAHSTSLHQCGDKEATDEWPDPSVMVMMRNIEHAVVIALIGIAGFDYRKERRDWP
jgi:hypothetical protein